MRKRQFSTLLFLLYIIIGGVAKAQSLTLDECKRLARENYPAIQQYGLIEKSKELNLSNASKSWLPGVSVQAFGAAYTDVLKLSDQMKMVAGDMKNYLAGGALSVSQAIYDGGAIRAQKEVMAAKAEVEARQMDVTLYALNERIEQLYFGTLMMDEQLHQNQLLQEDLKISEKTVESLIRGGLANESDLDAVNVRQVQAEQQAVNLKAMHRTYLDMLGYFIGKDIEDQEAPLQLPLATGSSAMSSSDVSGNSSPRGGWEGVQSTRPELSLFSSQESMLSTQRKVLNSKLLPTVGAFGLATLHTKPLDLMKAGTMAIGITAKWNIGALYTRKNDLAALDNQRQQIDIQRKTFLFNNQLQQRQSNGVIDNLRQQKTMDDKVVSLRERIREKAEKKVKNGTETVNELLRDINAVSEARQQKAIHQLQLLQEEYRLRTIIDPTNQ